MIDLLAASQVASIAGNAVSIIDKIYTQFVAVTKTKQPVHPPSIQIEDAPKSEEIVTKTIGGAVVQRVTHAELAAKLDPADLAYIKAREDSLNNAKKLWETIYPEVALASVDEQARLKLRLEKIAKDLSYDLFAILNFLENRVGLRLDDHYLAVRDIAERYQTS
jgi:hypothetical protein